MHYLQLAQFRTIQDEASNALTYNFRPVQAVNGRDVYHYHEHGGAATPSPDGVAAVTASLTLLSVASVAAMLLLLH